MTSISGTSPSPSAPPPDPILTRANKMLKTMLTSTDMIQALATQSSIYVPPNSKQILSTLWAMFDPNNTSTITKDSVQQAVIAEGGLPSDANALWSQMDPTHKGFLNAGDFITNNYLLQHIPPNTPAMLTSVKNVQQMNTGKSNTILDAFSNPNADVLSMSFNGSSPVGGPGSDYQKINIFA